MTRLENVGMQPVEEAFPTRRELKLSSETSAQSFSMVEEAFPTRRELKHFELQGSGRPLSRRRSVPDEEGTETS